MLVRAIALCPFFAIFVSIANDELHVEALALKRMDCAVSFFLLYFFSTWCRHGVVFFILDPQISLLWPFVWLWCWKVSVSWSDKRQDGLHGIVLAFSTGFFVFLALELRNGEYVSTEWEGYLSNKYGMLILLE